jgi:hypothetical protein
MLRNAVWTVVIATLLCTPVALQAQESADAPRAQISISPILLLAEIVNGEAEYAFSDEMAAVFGLGYFKIGEGDSKVTYLATDLKLRFYPAGNPLEGFALTAILGRTSLTEESTDATGAATSVGVDLGWSWLFGDAKRWFFGAGIGAKRYFGDESVGDTSIDAFLPTGRLNFGIAF